MTLALTLMLLLLLPVPVSSKDEHSEYQGTVLTYYPLITHPNTSVTVEVRYKSNSKNCVTNTYWCPSEGCYTVSHETVTIDKDSARGFCQRESLWTRKGPTNAPMLMRLLPYKWSDMNINRNMTAQGACLLELRSRSDTGQSNASPQITILPVYRVPRNCERDIRLLNFDPDGDLVRCRFGEKDKDPKECAQCRPPSGLSLSLMCTVSFRPSVSSTVGLYPVELIVEDFPRTDMVLTLSDGTQEARKTTDFISRIMVQFSLSVESSVPSCDPGLYLPQFVDPTPAHGAQINAVVNDTLEISIQAQAEKSMIGALWFSGPSGMNKTNSGGQYVLSWVPSDVEDGRSFPVCFMAEAVLGSTKYHSEPRCVIVKVRNAYPPTSTIADDQDDDEGAAAVFDDAPASICSYFTLAVFLLFNYF